LLAGREGTSKDIGEAISSSRHYTHETRDESARMDGNNVNMDVENVELARTTLQYQYQLNALNSEVSRLRTVIKG
jgi:flagellar basal-body rod protein FlgB